jgi:hypothetical protein
MITHADIDKLRHMRSNEPTVLSLYLRVPADPVELPGLRARTRGLIGDCGSVSSADLEEIGVLLAAQGRRWLGKSVAIFACGAVGMLEVLPMPCRLPERAVLSTAPHIRPLLAAAQRCPAYRVAIVDERHAWCLSVDDMIDVTGELATKPGQRHGFLEHHHVSERARQHYRQVAAVLQDSTGPLVIGGPLEVIRSLLRLLQDPARERFAGSFVADPRSLTPARARQLADGIVAGWAARTERRLTAEVTPGHAWVATGLPECLAAVNAGAVSTLLVPDDGMIPGFVCDRCGALSRTGEDCPDWGTAARPVPDLLEEMACRVLDDAGDVATIADPAFQPSARLRFTGGTPATQCSGLWRPGRERG